MRTDVQILRLSLLYFALVFGAGFVLGPIRVLILEPRLSVRLAELLEMPVMLLVIWVAAGWIARRFAQNTSALDKLRVGVLTVVYVLSADVAVGVFLRGMTVTQVFSRRDVVSSIAYYGLLALCAVMLWLKGKRIDSSSEGT